jgi:hypothetical protein
VKRWILFLVLFSVPLSSQVPPNTLRSTPIYAHGIQLPLVIDSQHNVTVISRISESIRKQYLCIFVGVHNTGASSNLDFDPSWISLVANDGTILRPMDAHDVREMAKGTQRRQIFMVMGVTMLLNMSNSMTNGNNPNMQVYQQMRTDDMSDAAFAKIADNFATIQKDNLLRTTVFPGDELKGFVYFDLGKKGAVSETYSGYSLNIPIGSMTYKMDFGQARNAYVSQPVAADTYIPQPATLQPVAVSHPLTSAPVVATPTASTPAKSSQDDNTILQITSFRSGADIELDGKFVGQTPSEISIPAGDHIVRLTLDNCVPWENKLHTTAGKITIYAELKMPSMVYRAH